MPDYKSIAKAIVGALTAGLTALGVALADGAVTQLEVIGIALAVLASFGIVFSVPNTIPAQLIPQAPVADPAAAAAAVDGLPDVPPAA